MSKVKLDGSSVPARNDNVLSITPVDLNEIIYASIMVRRSDHGTITLKEYADGVIAGTYSTMSHTEFKDAFGSDRAELDAVAVFAQSYGIQVAKLAGIPNTILQAAREKLQELETQSHQDEGRFGQRQKIT